MQVEIEEDFKHFLSNNRNQEVAKYSLKNFLELYKSIGYEKMEYKKNRSFHFQYITLVNLIREKLDSENYIDTCSVLYDSIFGYGEYGDLIFQPRVYDNIVYVLEKYIGSG